MAKVTLTLEDIINEDGTAIVRISAKSDNDQTEEYTPAEQIGEALLESFGKVVQFPEAFKSDPNGSLN